MIKFFVFSFDDDFIMNLHSFFKEYSDFVSNKKKLGDFLKIKLNDAKNDETLLNNETLNYKKHLENYKQKMKLIIQKMELDK